VPAGSRRYGQASHSEPLGPDIRVPAGSRRSGRAPGAFGIGVGVGVGNRIGSGNGIGVGIGIGIGIGTTIRGSASATGRVPEPEGRDPVRIVYITLGHLSIAAGVLGLFLPLLPTTPFVLLAAACYSRGSERLDRWIHAHPRFGPLLTEWRRHGVIRPRVKLVTTVLVVASLSYPAVTRPWPVNAAVVAIGVAVLGFVLSRPSAPRTGG